MNTTKNNRHRELCKIAGKFLFRRRLFSIPRCPYVCVELVSASLETPDVFGWNYWASVLIEVKVSRSDFMADKKKPFRQKPEQGIGEFRYYFCPEGMIKTEELPEHWGLLYEKEGKVKLIKKATRQVANHRAEVTICSSIMRREKIKPQIFDYRKRQ